MSWSLLGLAHQGCLVKQSKDERENMLLAEDSSDEPLQHGAAKPGQWLLLVMGIVE
jgi:hypothetical protein